MTNICLVTGANGHLGNNLVRALLDKGEKVRASVRNVNYLEPFEGLDCEVVYADLLDRESLSKAMKGVDTLYQVAAERSVNKVVYVSSTAALDYSSVPIDETSWNSDFSNPYYQSKIESEKLALRLAKELDLWLISVLPSGMIGPNCFGHLTPTMEILNAIVKNKLPFDINFHFNYLFIWQRGRDYEN